MDGIHDLGGKIGYGPIDVAEPEEPFHAPYEGRMWAISRLTRGAGFTVDWWRHVRELIAPNDYLNRPYFDSWAQTTAATMIDSGVFSKDELTNGQSETPHEMFPPSSDQRVRENHAKMAYRFDREIDQTAKFAVGDLVLSNSEPTKGHTRLPEYARAKHGRIFALRDAHVLPDAAAFGSHKAEPLYTVSFLASELWGTAENPEDCVLLDLWESYLAPA